MAQLSRAKRTMARIKRRANLAEGYAKLLVAQPSLHARLASTEQALMNHQALLLALLVQAGGSLEVTRGTQAQVNQNLARLNVEIALKEGDEQTLVVKVVEAELPELTVPRSAETLSNEVK